MSSLSGPWTHVLFGLSSIVRFRPLFVFGLFRSGSLLVGGRFSCYGALGESPFTTRASRNKKHIPRRRPEVPIAQLQARTKPRKPASCAVAPHVVCVGGFPKYKQRRGGSCSPVPLATGQSSCVCVCVAPWRISKPTRMGVAGIGTRSSH